MQGAESERSVSQVINWYLAWALKGKHSPNGESKNETALGVQRGLAQFHIDQSFLARKFVDLTSQDIQDLIDRVAGSGAEPAAYGLKKLFTDVDKFAVRQSVLQKVRTRNCSAPNRFRPPRILTDRQFADAWDRYLSCAQDGSIVMRGPSLATLVSAVTLQPLQRVVGLRREWVDFDRRLWVFKDAEGQDVHHVHLSQLATDLLGMAFALGDFVHRDEPTSFVFSSAGPKRDPMRPIGFTSAFDVTDQIFGDADIKPADLSHTGFQALRALGGEPFRIMVESILEGCGAAPSPEQVLVAEAWSARIGQLQCKAPKPV